MKTTFTKASDKNSIKVVAQLAEEIWHQHFTPIIGKDQVVYMVEKFQSEPAITQQIADGYEYYLIEMDNESAGYYAIQLRERGNLFLSKIYIKSTLRGRGIGRQAIEEIMKKAQEMQANKISLTVNKYNTDSINAYLKMGFKNVDSVVADIGNGFVMDDYILEKEINRQD